MTEIFQYISALPDLAKALIVLAVIVVAFFVFKAIFGKKGEAKGSTAEESAPAVTGAVPPAQTVRTRGTTTLTDTDEKTAAVIMAIISDRLSVPLERLYFESIKCINEPVKLEGVCDSEAAVIMAITSHMTGKPLQRLSFTSIRLISE